MTAEQEAHAARNEVLTAFALIVMAQVAFCFIGLGTLKPLLYLRISDAAACTLAFIWLWSRRPSVRVAVYSMAAAAVPLFVIFWLDEAERAAARSLWVPFFGPKTGVLGVALLAPDAWLGVGLIAALALETGILTLVFRLDGLEGMVHGEPWITFVYVGISIVLLKHRHKRLSAERTASRATAHAEAMERQARIFMALRDLANTPLQTLDVNVNLLREQMPQASEVTDRMARAIARLKEMSKLLAAQPEQLKDGDESIDPLAILGKKD